MAKEEMVTIPRSVYESEKKMRFFGCSSEEVYRKKFNIFIGISISNKKLTPEMALNYLRWAVRNTKGLVAIVIADELNIVNYEILDKYSSGKSKRRAEIVGNKYSKLFEGAIKKLPKKDQSMIKIFRWKKIRADKHYQNVRRLLDSSYYNDSEFKAAVLYFIKKYMKKKGRVITDEEKINTLATYILGELPTLLEGITVDKKYYGLCIYPTYFASGMSQFVMDIHAKELDIGNKIKKIIKHKAALVEAWLD